MIASVGAPHEALAHQSSAGTPVDLSHAWDWSPLLVLGLTLLAGLYGRGLFVIWRRIGLGRGVSAKQAVSFGIALLVLVIALASPLAAWSSTRISVHMAQHLVLIFVVAPLLVAGAPLVPALWGLPPHWRLRMVQRWHQAWRARAMWSVLTHPLSVWALHTVTLWVWHLPGPYLAVRSLETVHALAHLSFLGSAMLFWWELIQPLGRWRLRHGIGILFVCAVGLQGRALGILLTFSATMWYSDQAAVSAGHLTPVEDQQLAGLIMLVVAGAVYLVAVLALCLRLLGTIDRQARRHEIRAWREGDRSASRRAPRLNPAMDTAVGEASETH